MFCRRPGRIYMVLILSDLLVKNYGRLCQKKSKSHNHQKYLKEILSPSKPWTAAASCTDFVPNLGFLQLVYFVVCDFYILYSWP